MESYHVHIFWALKMGSFFWGVFRFAVLSAAFSSHFLSSLASENFAVILHKSRHEALSNLHCHWQQYFMITALGCPPLLLLTLLGMCEVCTEAVHSVFEHELHHTFGHVWSMYRSSRSRITLNTSYITGLDMCKVCTEAVHSVALWTQVTSQVWICVKYVPKQSIP